MTLNRRTFVTTSAAAAGLSMAHPFRAWPRQETPPNVVLIMADDLGYETIGVNGCAEYQTPNLDRMAQQGTRFTHCHVNPLCTPTRCAIMTGRYNYRNYYGFGHLHRNEVTFGHMFQNAGYATAAVGKWQLGNGSYHDQSPAQAGFDEYCLWNLRLGGTLARDERFADANLIYHDRETGSPQFHQFEGEYGPDVCTEYLCDFMEGAVSRGQPFFAYYPMILTHWPFKPTPHSPQWQEGDRHEEDPKFFKDMVEYMDHLIGEIAAKLEDLGVADNTLLIFLGDNGTYHGITTTMKDGREVQGGKSHLDDGGTHVPLIAHGPGLMARGQVIHDLVDPTDFLPTLAQATGVPLPHPPDGRLDGVSFWPQLQGRPGNSRDWVLIEYYEDRHERNDEGRFVRDHRYKLYDQGASPLGGQALAKGGQFYDLQADPQEERPLDAASLSGEAKRAYARFQQVLQTHPLPE